MCSVKRIRALAGLRSMRIGAALRCDERKLSQILSIEVKKIEGVEHNCSVLSAIMQCVE
jgi:hypothetical protein